jgi:hypothetical protein
VVVVCIAAARLAEQQVSLIMNCWDWMPQFWYSNPEKFLSEFHTTLSMVSWHTNVVAVCIAAARLAGATSRHLIRVRVRNGFPGGLQ